MSTWLEHIAIPIYNCVSRPRNNQMHYNWVQNFQRMIHRRQLSILDSILRWNMRYVGLSVKALCEFFDQSDATISRDFEHINMVFLKNVSFVAILRINCFCLRYFGLNR